MKKLIVAGLFLFLAFDLPGQGTVNFSNVGGGKIIDCLGEPFGVGTLKVALLFQMADGSLVQLGDPVLLGPVPGVFAGGTRTTPDKASGGIDAGAEGVFEVQAWSSQYPTYGDGMASSDAIIMTTALFVNPTGGGGAPPVPPAALSGFTGLGGPGACMPEPSFFALALLGATFLLPFCGAWRSIRSNQRTSIGPC